MSGYFTFFPISISDALIAFFLGFFLFILTESLKKPIFKFKVIEGQSIERNINNKKWKFKFLNIEIENKKRPKLFSFFNKTANNSRAYLIFKDASSKLEIKKLNARWYTGKEPVEYMGNDQVKIDLGLALIPQREVIPSGEIGGVSIGIKFDGDKHFYAFNNESYLYNHDGRPWAYDRHKLPKDHYLLTLKITSEGKDYCHDFLIKNPNKSVDDFVISDLFDKNLC